MSSDTVVRHHTALPFIGGVVLAVSCRVPQNYGDFDGLFCGSSALLAPWSEVPPTPAFLGVGPIGFWLPLALIPVPGFFVAGSCSCLSSVFSPLPWFLPPFFILNTTVLLLVVGTSTYYQFKTLGLL